MISILLAVRNEEATLMRCLEALDQLDYPKELLEVLIGNDQSEDGSRALILSFVEYKPHFRFFDITERVGQQRGKANVLAQLARHARRHYFFFTDADVAVPPAWIGTMLPHFQPDTGLITGVTTISGSRLFDKLQAFNWLLAFSLLKTLADWNIPVTTMGNNMAIRRSAYEAVGGYEALPFSIVEDIQLFYAIRKQGFGFQQLFEPGALAHSMPVNSLRAWLHQRKRWKQGTKLLRWYLILLLYLQALFPLALLVWAFFSPVQAFLVFAGKGLIQGWHMNHIVRRLRLTGLLNCLLAYQLYEFLMPLLLILYTLLPGKTEWKGRRY